MISRTMPQARLSEYISICSMQVGVRANNRLLLFFRSYHADIDDHDEK